jgi:hypothetical protein
VDGIHRLTSYLAAHHPDEYGALQQTLAEGGGTSSDATVEAYLRCYRQHFDPAGLTAAIEQLQAEHTRMVDQWADLPTPLAREKAKQRFTELESRIKELQQQQTDSSAEVERHYREFFDLQQAIMQARSAMKSGTGAQALRQRAEAL